MNSVFCRFLFVSLLKLGICSLIAMNCASFAIAQAVLNPNHIKGKVEFTNTNPLILEFFNTNYGANGFWNARVSASENSRYHYTDTIYNSQWHSSTGSDYELTVESSAAGISYRIETSAFFEYWNDWYIFDAVQAAPVYPEPAPDTILNFRQCVGLLEMSWRDHAGNPVAVTGGQARAYRKKAEPPTEYWMPTHDLQALSWNFTNGAAKEYLPVRGDGGEYLVEVLYDLGADPYNDKIRRLCQKMVNVSCDQIVSIVCDVPPPTLLGQISGTVDMVGVNEQRLGDLTRLYLWNGPFNNHRYATVDSSPSSGSFTLKNLLPDLPGETENVVHAHMLLREGNEEEYFISPLAMASEVPALHAEPGKTKDLGDTFIMKPGYVTGSITLAGPPPESGGACLQHIYRETPEYYRTIPQPDIYIIGQTFVQAWGSGMRPSGSTLSSSGGFVRTKFPGSYNPQTANFEGSYNLILAGLKGEPSNWLFAELGLQFYTPSPDTIGEYIDSTVVISDNKIPQRDIYPGTTTQADRSYCMSEVRLSYRTLSGTIFGPAATLYGSFQGNDFQGKPADYQISWSYAANGRAEQAAQTWVTMCMPQGKYTVMPSVWAISPSGSMSQVSLPSFEVDIGCRQVIDLTTELQLSLGQLPQETSLETITLYGAANGSKNIARIFYTQNGSGEKTICSNCGDDPPFSTEITLNAGINEIVVTVVDAGGNRASAKAYITYNPVPDDGGSNPPDGEEICAGGKLLLCHYPPGNTGNPQSLRVPFSAVRAHLDHGDTVGDCPAQPPGQNQLVENETNSNEVCRTDSLAVCHIPPGNTRNAHTIYVPWSALKAHLMHGDLIGFCPDENNGQDSDNDGISDYREIRDGTNPLDPGSAATELKGPVYTLWNRALNMTNILELVNQSNDNKTVTVALHEMNGRLLHQTAVPIEAMSEVDLILNDMPGFSTNPYGLVRIDFEGRIDGRVFFYRSGEDNDYEFAFDVPLVNASFGTAAVSFNTFQPSEHPAESNNAVLNWLSLVNLTGSMQHYTVKTYNQDGQPLITRHVYIPAYGRADIDGGHVSAGPSMVGLQEIIPEDDAAPYLAQLIRYGSNAPLGQMPTHYDFAFALTAKSGNGNIALAPISRMFGEDNWLELANSLGQPVGVTLRFLRASGEEMWHKSIVLPPHGQQHFFAGGEGLLAVGENGTAVIEPQVLNSIIAQSMFYFRNRSEQGRVSAMYGSQAKEALARSIFGSYNLFLDMHNYLNVFNAEDHTVRVQIGVSTAAGIQTNTFSIPPHGATNFSLHDSALFGTAADTYGVAAVSSDTPAALLAEVVRLRYVGNSVDFAAATPVR